MPTYEYACRDCGEGLEAVQSFTDDPLAECPACGGRLRKVFSPVGISFKGSGFYKTDSRPSSKESSASSPSTASSSKEPASSSKEPASSSKEPASSSKEPASSSSSGSSSGSTTKTSKPA